MKNGSNQTITDTSSLAFLNPLRYRGYVYDDETGLYYLQSRYYDPTTCRFFNADVYCDTQSGSPLSTNLFAYCENCPLKNIDKTGEEAITIFGVIVLFVVSAVACVAIYNYIHSNSFKNIWNVMVSALVIKIKLLSKTINATGIAISLSVKAIAQKLADSFAKAKSIPRYKSKYELHHIVAQTAIKAAKARNILHKVRIHINSTENTVYLKTGLHRRIHTNEYYNLVNWIIEKA